MEVAPEGVGVLGAEVGLDAAQGEVHDGEAAGGGVALFRLTTHQPHPSGSIGETKPSLPSRRFVLAGLVGGERKLGFETKISAGVVLRGGAGAGHETAIFSGSENDVEGKSGF
jgi:hypothetical protein